ncbi:MAG: hypothetical protein PHQ43_09645 [Dehalococcoidales bacterium]|nr:hypothetical protein [Dehalococcoidales bacterium]
MMKQLKDIQNELIKSSQSWVLGERFDAAQSRELRRQAILLNHAHYLKNIPIYEKVAHEEGIGDTTDIETIKRKLMLSDGVFKSYNQEWLDAGDFGRMTRWLSNIYHERINLDCRGVGSIDKWLEQLENIGINVALSTGTSGTFSFIPKDRECRTLAKTANTCYMASLLARLNIGMSSGHFPLKQAIGSLPPSAFMKVIGKAGLPDFDAAFLGFRQGRTGNQTLIEEMAPFFHRHYFLYDIDISTTALRCLQRGPNTEQERQMVEELQTEVVSRKEVNYLKLVENIRKSIQEGRKVFIFGAPYQLKELCEVVAGNNKKLELQKGSLVLMGGGWKSFAGEAIDRDTLVDMLAGALNIPPQMVLEGYSMTEINTLMLCCEYGRFHIPPLVEPVIFDKELNPFGGKDLKGAFGFLDPLAVSYPGFIISGDQVRFVAGECPCGLTGPAITEIGRQPGGEIKGCGGIMGSMQA